jgi:predicted dehydrogenase
MVGIGIIGCGERILNVAKELFAQSEELKLVAIYDPSEEAVQQGRAALGSEAKAYADYHGVVNDPKVDWVIIGSWNCFHAEQSIAALQAGKNVFCEKPLATTLEDCLAIREAVNKSGKQFAIGFTLRYSPHCRKLKEIIDAGTIGKIISMEFNEMLPFNHGGYIHQNWRRKTQWAGTHLLEKCCHDLDLVNWYLDSLVSRVASFGGVNFFIPENEYHIKRIGPGENGKEAFMGFPTADRSPFTTDKDIVDNQVVIMEFANGVRATFHTNCLAAIWERRMYILGTEGTIRADIYSSKIEVERIGWDPVRMVYDTAQGGGHGGSDPVLVRELAQFMLKGIEPKAGIEDGLKSAITAFGIDKANNEGRVVDMQSFWDRAGIPLK